MFNQAAECLKNKCFLQTSATECLKSNVFFANSCNSIRKTNVFLQTVADQCNVFVFWASFGVASVTFKVLRLI